MSIRRSLCALAAPACVVVALAAQAPDRAAVRQAILTAEDSRAPSAEAVRTLVNAANGRDEDDAVAAVRALGRLERPSLASDLTKYITAASPRVRMEAANALGQAVSAAEGDPVERARRTLLGRLSSENDLRVLGVICETLGRLPYTSAGAVREVETALVQATLQPGPDMTMRPSTTSTALGAPVMGVTIGFDASSRNAVLHVLAGATKGLEALVRQQAKRSPPQASTLARLRRLVISAKPPTEGTAADLSEAAIETYARVRRLAFLALNQINAADESTIAAGLDDDDAQVRRLAAQVAGEAAGLTSDRREKLIVGGRLHDTEPMVRLAVLRAYAGLRPAGRDCAPIVEAIGETNLHVSLAAIDLVGSGCAEVAPAIEALAREVRGLAAAGPDRWHGAAHALVSLARLSRARASEALPEFASHRLWQVRMYAARAASALDDAASLERLAADQQPNVREAAIGGLLKLKGHEADAIYLDALASSDYQLARTAAGALKGTPAREKATAALIAALARITAEKRDTSRDPRMAILGTLRETGSAEAAPVLEPYLKDFDPRIAAEAAAIITAWTAQTREPVTKTFAQRPAPVWAEVAALGETRVRVLMRRGGAFEMALYASEAPVTVARILRLARGGYYDGLTFHRIVANFIIQGGSPGANEYAGDDPYMRDEVGLRSHTRGTVGISTRGRDTGDAQIFINLVDNPRLDHQYTVFAEVVRGMDVVDRIAEGDAIERVEIVNDPLHTIAHRGAQP